MLSVSMKAVKYAKHSTVLQKKALRVNPGTKRVSILRSSRLLEEGGGRVRRPQWCVCECVCRHLKEW